jgi:Fe2+ transport system protein FeoA
MDESQGLESQLASVPKGKFVCARLDADEADRIRLERLGICVGRTLELLSAGDPMIVRVAGARLGLSRKLATVVYVRPAMSVCRERPRLDPELIRPVRPLVTS